MIDCYQPCIINCNAYLIAKLAYDHYLFVRVHDVGVGVNAKRIDYFFAMLFSDAVSDATGSCVVLTTRDFLTSSK